MFESSLFHTQKHNIKYLVYLQSAAKYILLDK